MHLIVNSNNSKPRRVSAAAANWFFAAASWKRSELRGHRQGGDLWYLNADICGGTWAAAVIGFSQSLQTKRNLMGYKKKILQHN